MVQYITPPKSDGLGTMDLVEPGDEPIEGVVILEPQSHDLVFLRVRLTRDLQTLKSQIIQHAVREASHR